jgi:hypothetical protein
MYRYCRILELPEPVISSYIQPLLQSVPLPHQQFRFGGENKFLACFTLGTDASFSCLQKSSSHKVSLRYTKFLFITIPIGTKFLFKGTVA